MPVQYCYFSRFPHKFGCSFFFLCESYFSYIHVESNFTSNKLAEIWDTMDQFWSEKLCLTKGHQRPLPSSTRILDYTGISIPRCLRWYDNRWITWVYNIASHLSTWPCISCVPNKGAAMFSGYLIGTTLD